jgi:DNA replication protein DnaC
LIKEAHFRYKASFEELMIDAARGVDAGKVARLGTGDYIKKGDSIIVTGASGCGKSFLATALGYKACFQGYRVQYYNMQKLLAQLKLARIEGVSIKLFEKIAKADLLIIDDFGMNVLEGYQQNDFMEILEDRHALKSTIIVSQLPVSKWFDVIGNGLIADAALDRIVHTSHRFELKGESLRKKN